MGSEATASIVVGDGLAIFRSVLALLPKVLVPRDRVRDKRYLPWNDTKKLQRVASSYGTQHHEVLQDVQ